MIESGGFCDERFSEVRDKFEQNFAVRGDMGASFAAAIVVDQDNRLCLS